RRERQRGDRQPETMTRHRHRDSALGWRRRRELQGVGRFAHLARRDRVLAGARAGHQRTVAQHVDDARHAARVLVYEYSGGVPRVINMLCDRALMAGAGAGEHAIAPRQVREAADALQFAPPPPAEGAVAVAMPRHRLGLAIAALALAA